jgi:uncharacterized protein YbaR (Trm112 family)
MTDELRQLDEIRGRAGAVHVVLTGLTCRETSRGRRYPYPEFGAELVEALHGKLVAPRHRGLIRSTLACPVCATRLDGLANQPIGIATEVALGSFPPVQVDLAIPGLFCPGCRMQLVRLDDRSVDSNLGDALIAAFKSAGIKPG